MAELRAAGVGVDRVLMVHAGSTASSDLFQGVLTMLDPAVALDLVELVLPTTEPTHAHTVIFQDRERARHLGRELNVLEVKPDEPGPAIVRLAVEGKYDTVVVAPAAEEADEVRVVWSDMAKYVTAHAHCPVLIATMPAIPQEVVAKS